MKIPKWIDDKLREHYRKELFVERQPVIVSSPARCQTFKAKQVLSSEEVKLMHYPEGKEYKATLLRNLYSDILPMVVSCKIQPLYDERYRDSYLLETSLEVVMREIEVSNESKMV